MDRPENPNRQNPDEFGFEWVDKEELSPEAEELLKEYSVPVGRPPRKMAEIIHNELAAEARDRLEELRVEGYGEVDSSWMKAIPELQMNPYLLDDVHYAIYQGRKEQPLLNRFVSVSAKEIFTELHGMKESNINGALLQSKQTEEASRFLSMNMRMDETTINEALRKGSEGAFAIRSLHRLLLEKNMSEFRKIVLRVADKFADEPPMSFEEVGGRATSFINLKHNRIASWGTEDLSTDQRTVHLLVLRDLERSLAFGKPVTNFLGRHVATEQDS